MKATTVLPSFAKEIGDRVIDHKVITEADLMEAILRFVGVDFDSPMEAEEEEAWGVEESDIPPDLNDILRPVKDFIRLEISDQRRLGINSQAMVLIWSVPDLPPAGQFALDNPQRRGARV